MFNPSRHKKITYRIQSEQIHMQKAVSHLPILHRCPQGHMLSRVGSFSRPSRQNSSISMLGLRICDRFWLQKRGSFSVSAENNGMLQRASLFKKATKKLFMFKTSYLTLYCMFQKHKSDGHKDREKIALMNVKEPQTLADLSKFLVVHG